MEIKIKNEHLYFALGGIWENLDYKFRYVINQKVVENPDNDYVQTIDINLNLLNVIIYYVNSQSQGVSREINPEMFLSIIPQIQTLAAQGDGEAIEMMQLIGRVTQENIKRREVIVDEGREKILE